MRLLYREFGCFIKIDFLKGLINDKIKNFETWETLLEP